MISRRWGWYSRSNSIRGYSEEIGVTRERVRQMERQALHELRSTHIRGILMPYW
jgi:DNA-directed RNA polymerase sigma subunit (sigma70/sigma32)